ncbi:hypothetical protein GYMLUDRAFT_48874 [Collybiopsis luxurians FD-317 M1]|uniref:Delta(24(24(1)))-sterol reductase n=1 Tax=Collybiopsis luxurians FD-317 M1 TaxID=944289 RepID=A0A0D0BHR3_9AGAR|nr:hypothetical protein GYMLUDRAFT_48874 [Collybiopsis luxurians FD-317 M1]
MGNREGLRQRKSTGHSDVISISEEGKKLDQKIDQHVSYEFGGPWGVFAIMTGFPILMYYLWICLWFYEGQLVHPTSLDDVQPFLWIMWAHIRESKHVRMDSVLGQLFFQLFLAWVMPGYMQEGLPVPSLGYKTLMYNCNALTFLYATMAAAAALHYTGVFRLTEIIDNYGHLMSVSMIWGFGVSFGMYFVALATGTQMRMSGNFIYDVFMGASLNPRIGPIDLKMWAEDMFHEKWGFMVIFWNLSGVPFSYVYSVVYMASYDPSKYRFSTPTYIALYTTLCVAYYIHFKMQTQGIYEFRKAFPQLPGNTVENPTYIQTAHGNRLLTSGWWAWSRKPNYVADWIMSLTWGLVIGTATAIPYFYSVFFITVLVHRTGRDFERCATKYGKDWERYCEVVPYKFIPYVY